MPKASTTVKLAPRSKLLICMLILLEVVGCSGPSKIRVIKILKLTVDVMYYQQ